MNEHNFLPSREEIEFIWDSMFVNMTEDEIEDYCEGIIK